MLPPYTNGSFIQTVGKCTVIKKRFNGLLLSLRAYLAKKKWLVRFVKNEPLLLSFTYSFICHREHTLIVTYNNRWFNNDTQALA